MSNFKIRETSATNKLPLFKAIPFGIFKPYARTLITSALKSLFVSCKAYTFPAALVDTKTVPDSLTTKDLAFSTLAKMSIVNPYGNFTWDKSTVSSYWAFEGVIPIIAITNKTK